MEKEEGEREQYEPHKKRQTEKSNTNERTERTTRVLTGESTEKRGEERS